MIIIYYLIYWLFIFPIEMNLNHIAKKPFLDAFYAKPIMHHFLRAALYDAGA